MTAPELRINLDDLTARERAYVRGAYRTTRTYHGTDRKPHELWPTNDPDLGRRAARRYTSTLVQGIRAAHHLAQVDRWDAEAKR